MLPPFCHVWWAFQIMSSWSVCDLNISQVDSQVVSFNIRFELPLATGLAWWSGGKTSALLSIAKGHRFESHLSDMPVELKWVAHSFI